MLVRRSSNLFRSAFRFKGALRHGFISTKATINTSRFTRIFMVAAAVIPVTMLIYCEEDKDDMMVI